MPGGTGGRGGGGTKISPTPGWSSRADDSASTGVPRGGGVMSCRDSLSVPGDTAGGGGKGTWTGRSGDPACGFTDCATRNAGTGTGCGAGTGTGRGAWARSRRGVAGAAAGAACVPAGALDVCFSRLNQRGPPCSGCRAVTAGFTGGVNGADEPAERPSIDAAASAPRGTVWLLPGSARKPASATASRPPWTWELFFISISSLPTDQGRPPAWRQAAIRLGSTSPVLLIDRRMGAVKRFFRTCGCKRTSWR